MAEILRFEEWLEINRDKYSLAQLRVMKPLNDYMNMLIKRLGRAEDVAEKALAWNNWQEDVDENGCSDKKCGHGYTCDACKSAQALMKAVKKYNVVLPE